MARRRNAVLQSLEQLRRVQPRLNLMHVITFLYICENEGLNVSELAQICHTTRASASRNARSLADRTSAGALAPYAGWVQTAPNPANPHGRQLYLTRAGRAMRDQLDTVIAEARAIAAGAVTIG
jgi:DNA-binding MarR family transcriptional regulator